MAHNWQACVCRTIPPSFGFRRHLYIRHYNKLKVARLYKWLTLFDPRIPFSFSRVRCSRCFMQGSIDLFRLGRPVGSNQEVVKCTTVYIIHDSFTYWEITPLAWTAGWWDLNLRIDSSVSAHFSSDAAEGRVTQSAAEPLLMAAPYNHRKTALVCASLWKTHTENVNMHLCINWIYCTSICSK